MSQNKLLSFGAISAAMQLADPVRRAEINARNERYAVNAQKRKLRDKALQGRRKKNRIAKASRRRNRG